ncbi:MAG: M48 family metallopeptidase [Rhodobacteraceae bacterium]|nr:M48 family metallopeptidase [Paracoccaceae bacterium]
MPDSPRKLTLPGQPPIVVTLRRVARARRLSLRVSALDGQVTLSMPARAPQSQALAFLNEKQAWLEAAVARAPRPVTVMPDATIPFRGGVLHIRPGSAPRPAMLDGALFLPPDPTGTRSAARIAAFLKDQARAVLVPAARHYASALNRPVRAITLRDTRSRWGSCTSDGRLMFSWRLIMAPPPVLDYVAAHEAAHLLHMNHSRAYWDCVAQLVPDYRQHRDWLRAHGASLHAYRF